MGMIITILVVAWVVYMIIKKFYPQAVLLIAGIVLLFATYFIGGTAILADKNLPAQLFLTLSKQLLYYLVPALLVSA